MVHFHPFPLGYLLFLLFQVSTLEVYCFICVYVCVQMRMCVGARGSQRTALTAVPQVAS